MKYVALLRGINVGGNRRIRMANLCTMFASAGARDIVTYIQSGNVVFSHASRSAGALAPKLESAIAKATGFDVTVVLRTAGELASVFDDNPFAGQPDDHLHVMFLPERIPASALAAFDARAFAPERLALAGRELYFCLPNGLGRSRLAVSLPRVKQLGDGTMRNWRTTRKLVELATARSRA